jgi:hypothetical protein
MAVLIPNTTATARSSWLNGAARFSTSQGLPRPANSHPAAGQTSMPEESMPGDQSGRAAWCCWRRMPDKPQPEVGRCGSWKFIEQGVDISAYQALPNGGQTRWLSRHRRRTPSGQQWGDPNQCIPEDICSRGFMKPSCRRHQPAAEAGEKSGGAHTRAPAPSGSGCFREAECRERKRLKKRQRYLTPAGNQGNTAWAPGATSLQDQERSQQEEQPPQAVEYTKGGWINPKGAAPWGAAAWNDR